MPEFLYTYTYFSKSLQPSQHLFIFWEHKLIINPYFFLIVHE